MGKTQYPDWEQKSLHRFGPVDPSVNHSASDEEMLLQDLLRQIDRMSPRSLDLLEQYVAALKAQRRREE